MKVHEELIDDSHKIMGFYEATPNVLDRLKHLQDETPLPRDSSYVMPSGGEYWSNNFIVSERNLPLIQLRTSDVLWTDTATFTPAKSVFSVFANTFNKLHRF